MNPDRAAAISRLAELIVAVERRHPVRVAIDGFTGSGKTVLANELAPAIRSRARPCIRASVDGFHKPRLDRYRRGRESPEGYYQDAFDTKALRSLLLDPLGPRGDRRYQTAGFDLHADRPLAGAPRQADRHAVLVVDGVFLQRPELEGHWDFAVWVECDLEVARARGAARDRGSFGPEVDALYRERYMPAMKVYLAAVDAVGNAHVRFVNNDPDHPVLITR
ncbi:MAG TPA: uridylate kinase [Acidimicrobiia bacterium]|nr:uridylate kinase [Acidimicrobiia bacterium]